MTLGRWQLFNINLLKKFWLSLCLSLFVISSSGYAQAAITITNGPNVDQGTTYNNFTFFGASGGVAPYTYSVSNFGGPGGTNWTSGSFVFNSNARSRD